MRRVGNALTRRKGVGVFVLRIMGKLGAAGGRLTSSGPESGIVDGESPSISLSYIDKAGYKRTNTCVHTLSTESVCQELGSCLMARYLNPTVRECVAETRGGQRVRVWYWVLGSDSDDSGWA